ncbi:MAG: hypothetical protein CMN30_13965 [Sandaracinus sp.]|nr:hypothetical protein [Sandaracinus sp.]|tara:strand:- start:26 stop:382 length:357 start_codon:yes stop_codon:yes gene_type:complete
MTAHSQLLRTRRKRPTLRDMKVVQDLSTDDRLARHRRDVFDAYVAERALSRRLAILLELVLEGARGPILCHGLRTDDAGLQRMEREFSWAAGISVYVAAMEVLERASHARRTMPPVAR